MTADNDYSEKLNNHLNRLATLKRSLDLLLYCIENEYYSKTSVELVSFGLILSEYISLTKMEFNQIMKNNFC